MYLNTQKLRIKLFSAGITQKKLAEKIGVSKNTVNAVFCGRSCKESTAAAIADALGVTLDSILLKR